MPDQLQDLLTNRAAQPAPTDPLQALKGARTIGPSQIGERYLPQESDSLVRQLLSRFMGPERPPTIAAADPFGIGAWQKGAGPMPMMAGTMKMVGGNQLPLHPLAAEMKAKFPTTTEPNHTDFLLPDGTRLKKIAYGSHDGEIYQQTGKFLPDALAAGVTRYSPPLGIETSQPLTEAQAQIIADDWKHHFGGRDISLDINRPDSLISKTLKNPTADAIRMWVKRLLADGPEPYDPTSPYGKYDVPVGYNPGVKPK